VKILIFSLNYAPELTATGKYTGEMAAWFAGRGHEVHAIVGLPHYPQWELQPGYSATEWKREKIGEVLVDRVPHYIPCKQNVTAGSRIRMDFSFIFKSARYWIRNLFARERYDVVIVICPPLFTSVFPMIYRLFRRVPWVIHLQDIQVDMAINLGLIKNRVLKRFLYWIEKRILNSAQMISTISHSMAGRLSTKTTANREIRLTPNWATKSIFENRGGGPAFRRDMGIPADKFVVMYSGNLGRKQGLEVIIDAAKALADNPDIYFVIAGDGVAKMDIMQRAKEKRLDNMLFLPVQGDALLADMLQAADVHLVVQKYGTADSVLPSKLTNIMASGKHSTAV